MSPEFFTVHAGIPREGPGEPADVARATAVLGVAPDARILDAGCGPGADIAALLGAAPGGHVTARDTHAPFVARVSEAWGDDPRVAAEVAPMANPGGPFDLIWSAGALYTMGLEAALAAMRRLVAPGGGLAFSQGCLFEESPEARAFWGGDPVLSEAALHAACTAAGWQVVESWRLSDAAWQAYYGPLRARCDALEPGAGEALLAAVAEARAEAAVWEKVKRQTGYLFIAARPA
ncbi:trans-aconitate 2-methyltransferase [Pseudoroseicyclus sp. CXY001]|uniref:class I SAM-dependent methyltransferase n=1 Tax=Pseudoroseicyclus sp. CXY001 TaxID=3242492 RepID=UPI0035709D43